MIALFALLPFTCASSLKAPRNDPRYVGLKFTDDHPSTPHWVLHKAYNSVFSNISVQPGQIASSVEVVNEPNGNFRCDILDKNNQQRYTEPMNEAHKYSTVTAVELKNLQVHCSWSSPS